MIDEFEAKFAWANSDRRVVVVFLLCSLNEQSKLDSLIECRIERFVEYRSSDGNKTFDVQQLPEDVKNQVQCLLGAQCSLQRGVECGGVKYIESPRAS